MTYRKSFLLTAESPLIAALDQACEQLQEDTTKGQYLMATKPPVKPVTNGISDGAAGSYSSSYFLRKEVERLKKELKQEREGSNIPELTLKGFSEEVNDIPQSSPLHSFKTRKTLRGPCKIMSFDWSPDHRHIVCGGQNGSAFVWDAFTGHKEVTIHTSCEFVLTCSYSPSTTLVACGGFNQKCAIYSIEKTKCDISVPKKEVGYHDNYITNLSFFGSDQQILTCGADSKVALWDIERQEPVQTYHGHSDVVSGLTINRANPFSVFATCGMDCCVKVWDVRTEKCVQRVDGIDGEVNQVRFFPTGNSLGYTTAEGKTYLYDLKSGKELQEFYKKTILFGGSSLDFSMSGRILFVGYEDASLRAWDTLKGDMVSTWYDHDERISNVLMSCDHMALGTSSWDNSVKIWA